MGWVEGAMRLSEARRRANPEAPLAAPGSRSPRPPAGAAPRMGWPAPLFLLPVLTAVFCLSLAAWGVRLGQRPAWESRWVVRVSEVAAPGDRGGTGRQRAREEPAVVSGTALRAAASRTADLLAEVRIRGRVDARWVVEVDAAGRIRNAAWQGAPPLEEARLRAALHPWSLETGGTPRRVRIRLANLAPAFEFGRWAGGVVLLLLVLGLGVWLAPRLSGSELDEQGTPRGHPLAPRLSDREWTAAWVAALWLPGFLGWLFLWRLAPELALRARDPGRLGWPESHLAMLLGAWVLFGGMAVLARRFAGKLEGWLFDHWEARYWIALGAAGLLFVTGFTPLGRSVEGHRLWLKLPGLPPFQSIELVKVALALFVADTLRDLGVDPDEADFRKGFRIWSERFRGLGLGVGLTLLGVAAMRDFGPMLLLCGMVFLLLFLHGQGRAAAAGLLLLAAALAAGYVLGLPPVWRDRVDDWLQPFAYSDQLARALWAFRAGGLWGVGIGAGLPQDVPVIESDYLLAALGEELGWLGVVALLLLMAGVCGGAVRLALVRASLFYRTLGLALAGLVALQGLFIAGGVLGVLPLTGVTFPLFSRGGTSLVVILATFGWMLGAAGAPEPAAAAPSTVPVLAARLERLRRNAGWLSAGLALAGLLIAAKAGAISLFRAEEYAGAFADQPFLLRARRHLEKGEKLGREDMRRLAYLRSRDLVRIEGGKMRADPGAVRIVDPRRAGLPPRGVVLDRRGVRLAGLPPGPVSGSRERRYRRPEVYLHTVGRLALPGLGGVETVGEQRLRGRVPVSWVRRLLPGPEPAHPQNLRLTLDSRLQEAAYEALDRRIGSVVLLDAGSGELLAAVSRSDEDGAAGAGRALPLPHWRMAEYPPGSAFKLYAAGAALEAGAAARFPFVCTGVWQAPGTRYLLSDAHSEDAAPGAHGPIALEEALALSCNGYFAGLAVRLGPGALDEMTRRFGFGRPWNLWPRTGAEVTQPGNAAVPPASPSLPAVSGALRAPGERMPAQLNEEFGAAQLGQTGIGQYETRVSCLQMALTAAAVVNDGRLVPPRLLRAGEWEGRVLWRAAPDAAQSVLSEETARALRQAMVRVVRRGTGTRAALPGREVGGKTGTAEAGGARRALWFVGWVRDGQTRLAIAVCVEGKKGEFGGTVSAPIARRVLAAAISAPH